MQLLQIPEIAGLDSRRGILRIPPEVDVPLTPRVRKIIDSAPFRRLASVKQLGFVSLVYPGAMHTRFEHSLGVFRLAAILLKQMAHDDDFTRIVPAGACELFLLTALLHDLGHYPYCHLIEDLHLGLPSHEENIERYILNSETDSFSDSVSGQDSEINQIIREDWHLNPEDVLYLLSGKRPASRTMLSENTALYTLLASMLSGPVDIDKMDYLQRDSLHAGVPYGRNYDQERLLASLCLNRNRDGLAISSKGKTAAELLVFARYVMFSEVYWHHTVRSATAMFQRLYYDLHLELGPSLERQLRGASDTEAAALFRKLHAGTASSPLCEALFGPKRFLYKQAAEFSAFEYPELYHRLARKPFGFLKEFAEKMAREFDASMAPHELLIDAPPVGREIEFKVEIRTAPDTFRPLQEVSPVVRALAMEQFDDLVKRVRIFVHPRWISRRNELLSVLKEMCTETE